MRRLVLALSAAIIAGSTVAQAAQPVLLSNLYAIDVDGAGVTVNQNGMLLLRPETAPLSVLNRTATAAQRDNMRINSAMSAPAWAVSTTYPQGAFVTAGGNAYEQQFGNTLCTSAATGSGPSTTASFIVDGTCQWNYAPGIVVASASMPTLTAGTLWAVSHVYAAGNIAVTFTGSGATSTGNFFTQTVSTCTSASSGGGPTGTGTGVTDGSCSWNYLTSAPTALFSGASANAYVWNGGAGRAVTNVRYDGGIPITSSGTQYEITVANTVSGSRTAGPGRYEFVTNSKRFVVRTFANASGSYWRVIVCGTVGVSCHYVSPTPYGTSSQGGSWTYTIVDFTAAGGNQLRHIILENESGDSFGGIDTLATEDVYQPAGGFPAMTMAVTGDSYPAGGGMTYYYGDFASVAADLLGVGNVVNTAIGGCGYLTPCTSGTAISRIADVTTTNVFNPKGCPDILLSANGTNDVSGFTPDAIAAAQTAYVKSFRATCGPTVPIFLMGLWAHSNGGAAGFPSGVTAETAMAAAAAAMNDRYLFFVPVLTDPQGSWQTGTGTVGASVSTGTFATNVMTVTAMTSGAHQIGEVITAASVTAGTKITSFGTGTGQTGTYNLSTSPGTISSESIAGASTNGSGNTDYFLEGQGNPQNLHPNGAGNRLFAGKLVAAIRGVLNTGTR